MEEAVGTIHSPAFHEAPGDERLQRQHGGELREAFVPQLLADVVTGCAVIAGSPVPGERGERCKLAPSRSGALCMSVPIAGYDPAAHATCGGKMPVAQRPSNFGARFSRKALNPSRKSCDWISGNVCR